MDFIFHWQNISLIAIILGIAIFLIYFFRKKTIEILSEKTTSQFFQSEYGPIYYETKGKRGPFVLFIHGIGSSGYCWRKLIPYFEKDYQLVLPDLWGFGKSSKTHLDRMNLDTQVQVLMELMDHLNAKKFHVVGHSLGGHITFWLVKKFSDRILKVVAIAPPSHPSTLPQTIAKNLWVSHFTPFIMNKFILKTVLFKILTDRTLINNELIDAYYEPYRDPQAHKSFSKSLSIVKDERVYNELEGIQAEVLLLYGLNDKVIKRKSIDQIYKKLPHCQLETSPLGNHLPMEDDVLWLTQHILTFLRSGTDL